MTLQINQNPLEEKLLASSCSKHHHSISFFLPTCLLPVCYLFIPFGTNFWFWVLAAGLIWKNIIGSVCATLGLKTSAPGMVIAWSLVNTGARISMVRHATPVLISCWLSVRRVLLEMQEQLMFLDQHGASLVYSLQREAWFHISSLMIQTLLHWCGWWLFHPLLGLYLFLSPPTWPVLSWFLQALLLRFGFVLTDF